MLTTTGTLGVNAAFLQEIKADGRELRQLFVRADVAMGDQRPPAHHSRQIVEILHCLCDQLALPFALEEAYGYFD